MNERDRRLPDGLWAELDRMADSLQHRYWPGPRTTVEQVEKFANFHNLVFPEGYAPWVERLSHAFYFGCVPVANSPRHGTAKLLPVGSFAGYANELFVTDSFDNGYSNRDSVQIYRAVLSDEFRQHNAGAHPWMTRLLPFAHDPDYESYFCFDFSYRDVDPPIVWVNLPELQQNLSSSAFEYVAPSFLEFVRWIALREDETALPQTVIAEFVRSDDHLAWSRHRDSLIAST